MGAIYLLVLVVAFVDLAAGFIGTPSDRYTFDVIMGVCGTLTALTAAYDFRKVGWGRFPALPRPISARP